MSAAHQDAAGVAGVSWVDSHCHLDAIPGCPDALRQQAARAGVAHLVLPGVEPARWDALAALARRHGDSYALGIHPMHAARAGESDLLALRARLHQCRRDPHLVALGEIGLDFWPSEALVDAARQRQLLAAQIALAREFDLPLIMHVRGAIEAALQMLRATPVCGGVIHAFNGSPQQAAMLAALGFKLGLGGACTYPRARKLQRLAAQLPLQCLVLETDAPDMPPQWLRAPGSAANTPAELPRIARHVAQLRGLSPRELARATRANTRAALRGLPCMAVAVAD